MLTILNDRLAMSDLVKAEARALGFDLVGIAPAAPSAHAQAYRDWIAAGKQGEMDYLARAIEERVDVVKKLPWAKSVVCVAVGYFQKSDQLSVVSDQTEEGNTIQIEKTNIQNDKSKIQIESENETGKIARYAWGRDYHRVIGKKLERLEKRLREVIGGNFEARTYADTGPIMEREFAALAGLGWIGKHTLLIHPKHGSYFLLGEMVTSLELATDTPIKDHCGTCTRCIEACPTGAIEPYAVNGKKCISYLTLEHRSPIDEVLMPAMKEAGYLVGCDICQEVCPHNRDPMGLTEGDFKVQSPAPEIGLDEVLGWDEQAWDIATRGHAHRRARHEMWRRNAAILKGEGPTGGTTNHEGVKD